MTRACTKPKKCPFLNVVDEWFGKIQITKKTEKSYIICLMRRCFLLISIEEENFGPAL